MRRILVITAFSAVALTAVNAQAVVSIGNIGKAQLGAAIASDRITVAFDNTPLLDAIWMVAKRSGARVLFDENQIPAKKVTYKGESVTPESAFAAILAGTGVRVNKGSNGVFELTRSLARFGKSQGVLTGKVTEAKNGKSVAGARISVGSDSRTVTSGDDGSYRVTGIPAGTYMVTVRMVGYAKQSKAVAFSNDASMTVNFSLEPTANVLDQVIVTGTVVQTELKAVPSAITVITAKEIEDRGITKIDQLFRGDVPGMFAINSGSGNYLDEVAMYSRGATALGFNSLGTPTIGGALISSNPIKTYIDGVEMADSKYLSQIDPRSIERIEILTGPQASTIYGSNAINGVMQVFTKRGSTSRPSVMLNLTSGWVENNFSSGLTPQHDYGAQVNGIEGRISYSGGGSWNYMGPWTPGKQMSRMGGFAGTRLELPTRAGTITTDLSFRRSKTESIRRGKVEQAQTDRYSSGYYTITTSATGRQPHQRTILTGQTFGLTLNYVPKAWWSHELNMGNDNSTSDQRNMNRGFVSVSDSNLRLDLNTFERRSVRYATTFNVPAGSIARLTVTGGADAWERMNYSTVSSTNTLNGSLNSPFVRRTPDHNGGGFVQTQLGLKEKLFLTYGQRWEWNPAFGEDAQPNHAPRYGVAFSQDVGSVSTKLRASYGKSTRPPNPELKLEKTAEQYWGGLIEAVLPNYLVDYGNFMLYLPGTELGPENQQGWEGGIELYFGNKGSFVITRYNQTVDGLIEAPKVDSVRSRTLCVAPCSYDALGSDGYGYRYQFQYLNIASLRNQGWELQGTSNLGPISARGTYSWTKSRSAGVTPRYRSYFTNFLQYQPGASIQTLPEHTWALGLNYVKSATSVGLNVSGAGQIRTRENEFFLDNLSSTIRFYNNRQNITTTNNYTNFNQSYPIVDLNVAHRITRATEAILQVQNLSNTYKNDVWARYAVMGRQTKIGLRIKP